MLLDGSPPNRHSVEVLMSGGSQSSVVPSTPTPIITVRFWRAAPNYGFGCWGWVGAGSPGNQAEWPCWSPRFISAVRAGLPGGAVSRQLQLRPPNGFGPVPAEFGSALAGAAPTTREPRMIAALTSIFVIMLRVPSTFLTE